MGWATAAERYAEILNNLNKQSGAGTRRKRRKKLYGGGGAKASDLRFELKQIPQVEQILDELKNKPLMEHLDKLDKLDYCMEELVDINQNLSTDIQHIYKAYLLIKYKNGINAFEEILKSNHRCLGSEFAYELLWELYNNPYSGDKFVFQLKTNCGERLVNDGVFYGGEIKKNRRSNVCITRKGKTI